VRYVRNVADVRDLRCRRYRRYEITRVKWSASGSIYRIPPLIPPIVLRIPLFFIRVSWRKLIPYVYIRLMMLLQFIFFFLNPSADNF
jgi:hypothetical protein